jgi:hypothetical protein
MVVSHSICICPIPNNPSRHFPTTLSILSQVQSLQLRLPQHPILLGHKRSNRIHQRRTQRIISAQPQPLELLSNPIRLLRSNQPLLNNTTHKPRKLYFLPPFLITQLHMHEIQTVEGVVNFNASVHVYTTVFAGVALNHCFVVYDVEFFVSGRDGEGGAGDYADDAEDCGGGFPAFGAAAGVVVGDV